MQKGEHNITKVLEIRIEKESTILQKGEHNITKVLEIHNENHYPLLLKQRLVWPCSVKQSWPLQGTQCLESATQGSI